MDERIKVAHINRKDLLQELDKLAKSFTKQDIVSEEDLYEQGIAVGIRMAMSHIKHGK
jgi:hypothetical protein